MKENEDNGNFDLLVVGGGITGLAAAYIAAKEGKKVAVLEAGKNFGGLLSTFEIAGNRLEHYYHHFFTHDIELNWLINELGIADKLFFKKTSMGVYTNNTLYDFNSPIDLLKFKPISFIDKIKFGLTSIYLGKFANWKSFENVSCINWFNRFAGKSTTKSLWAPLLTVKFGPYADKVPLSWMIGRLKQRMSSRKSGDERLGYLSGSLQVLLNSLLMALKALDVKLISETPVNQIQFSGKKIEFLHAGNQTFKAKKFLFTIPGIYLSKLVNTEFPALSKKLNDIEYFGAVCVILELKQPLSHIYWMNIADSSFPFGGIIEHTNFIPPSEYNNSHIVYLSRYFAMQEDIAKMNEEQIKNLMIGNLSRINPEFNEDWIKNVFLFKTNTAATVCDLNFSSKIFNCKTEIENMYIANMGHVYPDERSTNNSIRIALNALKTMGYSKNYFEKTNSLSAQIGF